jgi:hypothetical protein
MRKCAIQYRYSLASRETIGTQLSQRDYSARNSMNNYIGNKIAWARNPIFETEGINP